MSLVITMWNESLGVAVSEGRVGAWVEGVYVPTDENRSKLSRLPNGCVLGVAGHSRKGFSRYASLLDVCADLQTDIRIAARIMGFRGLSEYIPRLLAECGSTHPELFFCITLLGAEGKIRGAAFDSDGKQDVPTFPGVTWHILSPSAEISQEVDANIRALFKHTGMRSARAAIENLQSIIRAFAARYPDINGNTFAETVSLPLSMNADNITVGTLDADMVEFSDGTALSSANRVQVFMAAASTAQTFDGINENESISALIFHVTLPAGQNNLIFFQSISISGTIGTSTVSLFEDDTVLATWPVNAIPPTFAVSIGGGAAHSFAYTFETNEAGSVPTLNVGSQVVLLNIF